jgi:carbon storage regulator
MLILSRKQGEQIRIGDHVVITVVRVFADKVRLGIEAPSDVGILREEIALALSPQQLAEALRPLPVGPPASVEGRA